MEAKVCKNCRKLFKYIFGPEICQECSKLLLYTEEDSMKQERMDDLKTAVYEDEEKFAQVRDYIITHPGATIIQIADDNGITPIKLLEWVRQERLEFTDASEDAWFRCKKCGTKIKSGTLCNLCKISL